MALVAMKINKLFETQIELLTDHIADLLSNRCQCKVADVKVRAESFRWTTRAGIADNS